MSTNYISTADDTDMAECEGEKVVTMIDVLQEQEEFEEDANAVLGASDDKNCTYSKGYIKRQAIYACLTCCSDAKNDQTKRAGVCLACSLNCHENHELIELYTRRNFRCDCGNPKFNSHPCQFTPNKTDLNEDNKYNQNFIGIYCTCHRPYPDPDAINEDEMIQCTICEDWLHASHLEATLPSNDQYAEMICKACMELNEFLHDYSYLAVNVDVDVDITVTETATMESSENENKERLPNGSFELSPSKQETDKVKNISIAMDISNKMEAMQYKISSDVTDNIEKESTAFINGDVIVSKDCNEKETLDKENVTSSKVVQLETEDATITEKTNKTEDNILKTNDIVTLSNTLIVSGKPDMSMENESIHEPNKSNSDESNVCNIDRIKTPLVVSHNENETVLKDETTTNNLVLGHVGNHFDLENLNCKSTHEPLTKIEENENLVKKKNDQDDCVESSDISNNIDTTSICLEGDECEVKTEDQSIEKKGEESNISNSMLTTVVNNGIDTALKNLENTQSEVSIKYHLVNDIKEDTEINPVHSTEVSSELDMVLNNLENGSLGSKMDKPTSETMVTEIDNVGILKPAEVDTNIGISVNNFEHNESRTKTEEQSTGKINKETDKNDISEHMEVDTNIDITLNNKENNESGAKAENTTATIDKETGIKGFTESTEGGINMNINNSNSKIEMEDQATETVDKEIEKKNISESNDVDTNVDSINNEPENTTAHQSIELRDTEIDKKDMESTKVEISLDTALSNLINSETKTEECSVKIEGNISEESIDQSDTLEKATRELLELTADMVEEPEEDILLDNSDTADTSKELNNGDELTEAHVLVITDNKEIADTEINNIETEENLTPNDTLQLQITYNKENTDTKMNNIETEENANISDISQLETFNCNNLKRENEHKRKYNEENDDINVKKAKLEEKVCLRPKGVQKIFKGATFWPSDFRQKLCTCNECLTMYKDLRLLFLLDPEDTVTAYETLGKEKIDGAPTTQYEKGLQALSSLDRVQQINALTEYNIMRDKLLDFLKSFKERREIVKEEDIRAFFADMKPRREPDGVYFCR